MRTEFVDIDAQDSDSIILPINPHAISNVKPGTQIIDGKITAEEIDGICADYDVITINKPDIKFDEEGDEEDEDQICVRGNCDVSTYYGCPNPDGSFKVENLFSELTDAYQRAVARRNLGVEDGHSLIWGNITGNLLNQKDLYTFVTETLVGNVDEIVNELNLKLAQWACEINEDLAMKADINSPTLTGEPRTALPPLSDSSNRIASTEWVNSIIESLKPCKVIKYLEITPNMVMYGDEPVNIKVTWDYNKPVQSQSINGTELPPDVRTITLENVTTEMIITLECIADGENETKLGTITARYPIYYGFAPVMTELLRTPYPTFTIDTGDTNYLYIFTPQADDTRISVNGLEGGFSLEGMSNLNGIRYYAYKSANYGLGILHINILGLTGYGE